MLEITGKLISEIIIKNNNKPLPKKYTIKLSLMLKIIVKNLIETKKQFTLC